MRHTWARHLPSSAHTLAHGLWGLVRRCCCCCCPHQPTTTLPLPFPARFGGIYSSFGWQSNQGALACKWCCDRLLSRLRCAKTRRKSLTLQQIPPKACPPPPPPPPDDPPTPSARSHLPVSSRVRDHRRTTNHHGSWFAGSNIARISPCSIPPPPPPPPVAILGRRGGRQHRLVAAVYFLFIGSRRDTCCVYFFLDWDAACSSRLTVAAVSAEEIHTCSGEEGGCVCVRARAPKENTFQTLLTNVRTLLCAPPSLSTCPCKNTEGCHLSRK